MFLKIKFLFIKNVYICEKLIIMYKKFENPSEIFALTKEGTRKLYDNLYDEMIQEGKDVVDYQEIKAMSTGVLCPDCNSSHVIKNGLQSGVQNYRKKPVVDSSE